MEHEIKINKVLVVLSPDLIQLDKPMESPLIQRAISLAKNASCELELFHIYYDGGLEHQLFESDADLERRREKLTDRYSTLLATMVMRLKDEGIELCYPPQEA